MSTEVALLNKEKNKEERYQSAGEVRSELVNIGCGAGYT